MRNCTADGADGQEDDGAAANAAVLPKAHPVRLVEVVMAVEPARVTLPALVEILLIPIPANAIVDVKTNSATTHTMVTHFRRIEILAFV
jgi:hypothetical protein